MYNILRLPHKLSSSSSSSFAHLSIFVVVVYPPNVEHVVAPEKISKLNFIIYETRDMSSNLGDVGDIPAS